MTKLHKISILLLVLSISIIYLLFIHAEKVNTAKDIVNKKDASEGKQAVSSSTVSLQKESQELAYINQTKEILREYETLIQNLVVEKTEGAEDVIKNTKREEIEGINTKLDTLKVPAKYKDFHLLFSRSLLKLSTYINSANPKDKSVGLELYKQAKTEYDRLIAG